MANQPKIAFWFRYGPADNVELAHATPWILKRLAQDAEVHYFSNASRHPVPDAVREHTTLHTLPFKVNRSSTFNKLACTLLWYLAIPFIGLRCRFMGIKVVYIDDFLPLGSWLARVSSGAHVSIFVVDFLVDVYAEQHPLLKPVAKLVNAIDFATWRKLPLIFTRTNHCKEFLVKLGVPNEHVRTVYDACDMTLYHPTDRNAARDQFGYTEQDVVLVHHGVLHPNKSIDRILKALPPVIEAVPSFHFLVVGAGPEYDRLRALAKDLGLSKNVQFTGWLKSAEEVNVALNAGDIGLVMREGQPADHFHLTGALVHSMAVGLPVLAPGLSGMQEVIRDGETGFVFDPFDLSTFQERCKELAANAQLRSDYGKRAHEMALELFDVEKTANQVAEPLLALARVELADHE
jgi:glycosyltransferase involved in cell wall biosynthesis